MTKGGGIIEIDGVRHAVASHERIQLSWNLQSIRLVLQEPVEIFGGIDFRSIWFRLKPHGSEPASEGCGKFMGGKWEHVGNQAFMEEIEVWTNGLAFWEHAMICAQVAESQNGREPEEVGPMGAAMSLALTASLAAAMMRELASQGYRADEIAAMMGRGA